VAGKINPEAHERRLHHYGLGFRGQRPEKRGDNGAEDSKARDDVAGPKQGHTQPQDDQEKQVVQSSDKPNKDSAGKAGAGALLGRL
jgi:hypothetical protein